MKELGELAAPEERKLANPRQENIEDVRSLGRQIIFIPTNFEEVERSTSPMLGRVVVCKILRLRVPPEPLV